MVTQKEIDELRRKELDRPQPEPRPNMPGATEVEYNVEHENDLERAAQAQEMEDRLNQAADRMEIDHAFSAREGQAKAQFQSRATEIQAIDAFNGYADQPGRAEHELLVAEDRLANAVDEYIDHFENPELETTPEMVRKVEELNHDVVSAEEHHHAIHNNGLPLDPPLDVTHSERDEDREAYIRETTTQHEDARQLSREQYIEQTTEPSRGRPIDRTHSR